MESSLPAHPDSVSVTAGWTAPQYGTPVVIYHLNLSDGQWYYTMEKQQKVRVVKNVPVRCRVRGEDAEQRVGPWSEWSDWWP